MENKQLFEKQGDSHNPFFPIVRLEDIIDTIADKSLQWIFNNYNHIYVNWRNTIVGTRNEVPAIFRRNGLWITYNTGKEIITEYYIGDNTEVNNTNYWTADSNWINYKDIITDGSITYQHLSEALKQVLGEDKNITNFPDEEDLTTDGAVLSFKDREYEPHNFSGLGRVILRKNIIKDGNNFRNILTQDMINKSNTIYEIRYDFDLNDKEIIIPNDCIIEFNGGKIFNGIIIGNNTCINATPCKIFDLNLNLKGSFNIPYIYSEWYGAIGDGVNDDSYAINKALSSPIITLRLLDKTYNVVNTTDVLYNVNGSYKKANIIVPHNKIIIGTSTSDYTSNCTISVSRYAKSDFGVFISGRQVKLENIRVISNKNDDNIYSCDSLIVTQKGVSHLIFNQVHARFCNNNAMDIDCYGLTFNLCSAGDCDGVAYYIHGNSGNNTSATLISCAAGGAKTNGYLFHKMTYCSLISCSADGCGFDSTNIDINNIQHAYHIMECRFISMIGCGCEACYKAIKTSRDTRGLNATSCDFLIFEESRYPEGFDYRDIISLDFTEDSKFVNCNIGRRFSNNNLITCTDSAKVVFEDCYLQKSNDSGNGGRLFDSQVYYPNGDFYKNVIIINNVGRYIIDGYIDNLMNLNNTTIHDYIEIKISGNSFEDRNIRNINGKAILNSREGVTQCAVINNNQITNCNDLTIKNMTLSFNSFTGLNGFTIKNSVVVFDNVSFVSYHQFTEKKLMSLENSKVIFKNCKTAPGYNSSKYIKDVLNIDSSSSIEFIDNNIGSTEERQAFVPIYKGFLWYDTTINKPTWHNGIKWVDATGVDV